MEIKNKKVKIVRSPELTDLKLNELDGRFAVVISCLTEKTRKNKGYIVKLMEGKVNGELEWFIPKSSIKFL